MDKDVDDLNIKPSDSKDHSKWRRMMRGTGVTEAMTVISRAEYKCTFLMLDHAG